MKRFFHNEQDDFQNRLILMGQKTVEVTRLACKAVTDLDPVLAAEVIKADDAIDDLEVEIDREALPLSDGVSMGEALGDGEDYELLFTSADEIEGAWGTVFPSLPLTKIGFLVAEEGEAIDGGWDHFRR